MAFRILLTGGTGFFGKALLQHWLEQHQGGEALMPVTVLSRQPEAFLARYPEFAGHEWLRFHAGDILQAQSLPQGVNFSHILHAAADSTLGSQLTPLERYDQIVNGTRNLLDFAVRCGAKRFLLTSSGGVYGPQPPELERIPEDYCGMPDPLEPDNAYGVGKRCAEHLCVLYQKQYGIETVIARCFAFVGRDLPLDVHFAIGNFIRDALAAVPITIKGDGSPIRSYMDQRDLAAWLCALLERGTAGRAYNVGSDQAFTLSEVAHLVRDVLAPGQAVHILGKVAANGPRTRYVPSIERARSELGLTLSVGLRAAISEHASHRA